MKIYFSCSITGGRHDQQSYAWIVEYLEKKGHEVPTAHLSGVDVIAEEKVVHPPDVYQRDVAWISSSDALIAEVSTPSHGVGYEIALALFQDKPVLCCFLRGKKVSKMITGNDHPRILVKDYTNTEELRDILDEFLDASLLR